MTSKSEKPSKDKFAEEFILTGCKDGRVAAINAGYSKKTASAAASRLLKDVKVLTLINTYKKAKIKQFIKTKEDKLLILERVMDRCSADDEEKGMLNASSVIAAIKEHNLMQGDNAPIETNTKVTSNIMPVPTADSIDSWEQQAQKQQDKILNKNE